MEAEKRKRVDDEGDDQLLGAGVSGEGHRDRHRAEQAVTEEEVDEFFAILKRIHVAVKYFERNNDGKRWRPATFEKEGLAMGVNANNGVFVHDQEEGRKKQEDRLDLVGENENLDLDLNLRPAASKDQDATVRVLAKKHM